MADNWWIWFPHAASIAEVPLALMAQQCGLETGIDLDALCRAIDTASRIVGYQVGGNSRAWLARGGRVQDGLR